jgi:manganese/iron transport system permease protein/iron/zinc/copper transport system permease protein
VVGIALLLTIGVVVLRYRPLMFLTFDAEVAQVYGVRTRRLDTLFALILAVAVISTLQVLGATLVAAALVIPAVVARLCTDRFARMLWLSTLIGAACGFVGMYSSYYTNVASGATIVLTAAAVFIVVFAVQGLRGRVAGGANRWAAIETATPGEPIHLG